MSTTLSIGDFSLMTHLSIKTLRYYHQVGLLEPAEVNPDTGYRYYGVEQLPTAQIIQRFRDLGMPIDEVKAVLAAPDLDTRNALIATHLGRLEGELEQTRQAVQSLRNLLEPTHAPISVEHRTIPATQAVGIQEVVDWSDLVVWSARGSWRIVCDHCCARSAAVWSERWSLCERLVSLRTW